jgi:hypothetical protein
MNSSRSSAGAQLSGVGALILLVSLWLPWYAIRMPDALRDAFKGLGDGAAGQTSSSGGDNGFAQAFSGFLSGIAEAMPEEISAKGWTALDGADVALTAISAIAILLALSFSSAGLVRIAPADAGRGMIALGAIALVIVGYHIASPPGGDAPAIFGEDLVKLQYGLAVAAFGAVCLIAGGAMAQAAPKPQRETVGAPLEPLATEPYEPLPGYPSAPDAAVPAEPAPLTTYSAAPNAAEGQSSAPPGWAPPAA